MGRKQIASRLETGAPRVALKLLVPSCPGSALPGFCPLNFIPYYIHAAFLFLIWKDLLKLVSCLNTLLVLTQVCLTILWDSFFTLADSLVTTVLDPQAHLPGSLCTLKTWRGALDFANYICSSRNICCSFPVSSALLVGGQRITQ